MHYPVKLTSITFHANYAEVDFNGLRETASPAAATAMVPLIGKRVVPTYRSSGAFQRMLVKVEVA